MRNEKEPATWRSEGDINEECKKTMWLQRSETEKETKPQSEAVQITQRLGGNGRNFEFVVSSMRSQRRTLTRSVT